MITSFYPKPTSISNISEKKVDNQLAELIII